jgi:hypothetical protein
VWQLAQNPQGLGQGLTAAAMGLVTMIYAYIIVKRADDAKEHKDKWNWVAFIVLVLAGVVLIPLYAYADTAIIERFVPGNLQWLPRTAIGLSALAAFAAGICDIWFDMVPNKFARAGAVYATQDGASMLNGVF